MGVSYIDSSAGLKLVMREAESEALRRYVRERTDWTSSALFGVEVVRAARRGDADRLLVARDVIRRLALVSIDDEVLARAAELDPPNIRSFDAIHLATALRLGSDLDAIVTYDRRMVDGARALGLRVVSPA